MEIRETLRRVDGGIGPLEEPTEGENFKSRERALERERGGAGKFYKKPLRGVRQGVQY